MASANRTSSHLLTFLQALQKTPHQFDFLQTLRQLECAYSEYPRLGQTTRPAQEPIRLTQQPELTFAPSTLASFRPQNDDHPARIAVYFLGLFGPNGPLPLHLSEFARDRQRNSNDVTLIHFADLFHHRILTLFYRAWANARPTVNFDRPETDRFSLYLGALFGQGMPSYNERDAMPDLAKRHYAGRFATQTHHPEGLSAILTDFFQLPIRIEEFIGHWLPLPRESQWQLGRSPDTGNLGCTVIIGSRIWDRQYQFRIQCGPVRLTDYRRLLPSGTGLPQLVAIVRNYLGHELDWTLQLVLQRQDTPPLQLGIQGQLGWTTWLINQTPAFDRGDLELQPLRFI